MSQSDPSGEQPKVRWPETLRSPVLRSELCSPVYRCFPPMATYCLICKGTDTANCPFKPQERTYAE